MNERRNHFRALVVEDDPSIANLVKWVLERERFSVESVTHGAAAIELLKVVSYDLLILDLMLPEVSGEQVLRHLEESKPESLRRVIVVTASPRALSSDFLERICRILEKPFDIDRLILYARECAEDAA